MRLCNMNWVSVNFAFCFLIEMTMAEECEASVTDPLVIALAAVIPSIVAIAMMGIAMYFGVKYNQARKMLRRLTPEEVWEFLDGDVTAADTAANVAEAMLMPFQSILQPDKIRIDRDCMLANGHFSVVSRGFYEGEEVAIKTLKRTTDIDDFKAALSEAKIMAYIPDHVNIVRFIGADISAIADRKLTIVTELSPHGDLLGYLRKIEPGKLLQRSNDFNPYNVTPADLGRWCEEIACGMQHLESLKIVHGDLSARNILVFRDNIVKITDFGLSKKLDENSEYMMTERRMIPWRWCALEVLTRQIFSTDSDIWAFGVTVWEIFSLGQHPFAECAFETGFIDYLDDGNRLPKPTYATTEIYEILRDCWNAKRPSRPRFATLREFFQEESTKAGINNHVENLTASHGDHEYVNV